MSNLLIFNVIILNERMNNKLVDKLILLVDQFVIAAVFRKHNNENVKHRKTY